MVWVAPVCQIVQVEVILQVAGKGCRWRNKIGNVSKNLQVTVENYLLVPVNSVPNIQIYKPYGRIKK